MTHASIQCHDCLPCPPVSNWCSLCMEIVCTSATRQRWLNSRDLSWVHANLPTSKTLCKFCKAPDSGFLANTSCAQTIVPILITAPLYCIAFNQFSSVYTVVSFHVMHCTCSLFAQSCLLIMCAWCHGAHCVFVGTQSCNCKSHLSALNSPWSRLGLGRYWTNCIVFVFWSQNPSWWGLHASNHFMLSGWLISLSWVNMYVASSILGSVSQLHAWPHQRVTLCPSTCCLPLFQPNSAWHWWRLQYFM